MRVESGLINALKLIQNGAEYWGPPEDDRTAYMLKELVKNSAYVVREALHFYNRTGAQNPLRLYLRRCVENAKEMSRLTRAAAGWSVGYGGKPVSIEQRRDQLIEAARLAAVIEADLIRYIGKPD